MSHESPGLILHSSSCCLYEDNTTFFFLISFAFVLLVFTTRVINIVLNLGRFSYISKIEKLSCRAQVILSMLNLFRCKMDFTHHNSSLHNHQTELSCRAQVTYLLNLDLAYQSK